MGIIWAAILGGFALDFRRYMGEIPPPPIILHVHGAIYAIWLVLVSVQIFLVQSGDIRLHMRLGWATAIVSAAMVPLGLVAAMVDQARQIGHPDYAPQFLALEFEEMFAFSTFIIAGLLSRRNLAEHKRWMILSAVAISDAGFGRIWQMGIKHTLPGPFGWWLQYFWGITLHVDCHAGLGLVQAQARHGPGCLGGGRTVGRPGRDNGPQLHSCLEVTDDRVGKGVGIHWLSTRESNVPSSLAGQCRCELRALARMVAHS